jgi:hypothetical protein
MSFTLIFEWKKFLEKIKFFKIIIKIQHRKIKNKKKILSD